MVNINISDISIIKGDTKTLVFNIYDKSGNKIIAGDKGNVIFYVKYNSIDEENKIYKDLKDGIIYDENRGYIITINPKDTNNLDYGIYNYWIKITTGDFVKTTVAGIFRNTDGI